jgi:tRNA A-37 threonylcarbamoyl transferase component Bud32
VSNGAHKLVEVMASGVRWQVLPECQDLLFGPEGLRLEEWLRAGLAHVVKHGPHRTVYRVALPGRSFYLKHYRLSDARAWLRQLVRPAKARMEFDRALAVAERRVPTVSPVALGEGCEGPGPGDSFLITRGLEGTESVSDFAEKTLPRLDAVRHTRLRQQLAVALGEFVARLHDAGIIHQDLHAANLLVRLQAGDSLGLHLIDLHAVQVGQPLTWRVSRENLILLNRWFALRASRTDRLRFWRAYCRARVRAGHPWPETTPTPAAGRQATREAARDLEQGTWLSNLRFWRRRDRRCLASNRYYQRFQTGTVAGCAVRDLDSGALARLVADPDALFREPGVRLLKDSRSSTVAEFDLVVNGVVRRVIYKRFRVTSASDPWLSLVRRTPALRSWVYGHGLRERCLPTARPLAVLHRRRGPLYYEGYLLTEKISDAVDLHAFLDRLETLDADERQAALRRRIDQVASLVRALHQRQLSHRDLKAGNVLVTPAGVWLIDLVGVTAYRHLPRARRVQNLARLHASFLKRDVLTRTDKLRFLRVYMQWGLFGRSGWKAWWRAVAEATQIKVARNARSGRPLA